ncbi:MAG TPA: DEAD/DEAH box helicase [Candidatus Kapabacteria bacterium]|nr:DEAD/DEAH box helicase [Candidatus Kapabacteria bacterium]HOM05271.1 DEAD/DEAH box helicase [Candidatus Kapabacteria bacterium]
MLREYQEALAHKAFEVLTNLKIVYLAMEMRVGKTLIALRAAELLNAKSVLFVTKKKAISSIEKDYKNGQFKFDIRITNFEQLKKCGGKYDVVIIDEAHSLGAFPKPSQRTVAVKSIVQGNYLILLSGTPSPESESQLYHQFWVSDFSPFAEYRNFYKWAKDYVNVREMRYNGIPVKDYKRAYRDKIVKIVEPYMIRYTQKDAGFVHSEIEEKVIEVPIKPEIHRLVAALIRDRYYRFRDGSEIICDTPAKLQGKVHQLFSGTVRTESGKAKILDTSKAEYVKSHYKGVRLAIFYKFDAEGAALRSTLPNHTDDPDEFNKSDDKIFICQIAAGAMGVDLSSADVLLFYNIDFSSLLYWQARARVSSLDRARRPEVHWIFAEGGIERKIYNVVQKKKDYTLFYFAGDYLR